MLRLTDLENDLRFSEVFFSIILLFFSSALALPAGSISVHPTHRGFGANIDSLIYEYGVTATLSRN